MKATDANHTPWKTSAKKELQKQPLRLLWNAVKKVQMCTEKEQTIQDYSK